MNTDTDFDIEQARALVDGWNRQLRDARNMLAHYHRVESGLARMISGLQEIFPELTAAPGTDEESPQSSRPDEDETDAQKRQPSMQRRPRGMTSVDVVVAVVDENAGNEWLTVPQVAAEVERRGWRPPAVDPGAAIRTALSRAATAGRIDSRALDGRTKGYRRRTRSDTGNPAIPGLPGADASEVDGPSRGEDGNTASVAATRGHPAGSFTVEYSRRY
jgi:hypothetical protein